MRLRTRQGATAAGLVALLGSLLVPGAAHALEGSAPPSAERRVLSDVHTDAVSTFLDDGRLALATKADVPEGNGTRLDPAHLVFNVGDSSRSTVPAGYDFIGPAGSDYWLAPETNPSSSGQQDRLWPGFSTESVAPGAITGDRTTFTLLDLDGPGDLELFTGGFSGLNRLWSSDEGISSFEVGRTHMHANWAFTATGTYTLSVRADVTTPAGPQSATADYTFVVGEVPPAVATETALTVSDTSPVAGDPVDLDAVVTPADASGFVEFLDGATVLGHEPVDGGTATLRTSALPLGTRSLTARFVPALLNDFTPSASEAVAVTVTEEPGGEVFDIRGREDGYVAGSAIDLQAVGVTLADGQQFRWLVRTGPGETEYTGDELTGTDRFRREATIAFDGAQVLVAVIDADRKTLQSTDWHTIRVTGENPGTGEPITVSGLEDSYYNGDAVEVTVDHAPLTAGRSVRWVSRPLPYGTQWAPAWEWEVPTGDNPYRIDTSVLRYGELALQIVDETGTVLGQSPALSASIEDRELQLSGIQSVYRVGDTLRASSELYPARDGVAYEWGIQRSGAPQVPIEGATGTTVELPITADLDGVRLYLQISDTSTGKPFARATQVLRVTDAAPGEQLLLLDSLAGHYHQGNPIVLKATADPVASGTDTYRWSWQRPDQEAFVPIEGATGATHEVRAEQALDGTLVRAELLSASGEVLATSETVTIHVDDHGAAPRETVTITGLADHYHSGDEVSLSASVSPVSVLTRWEWYVQRPGEDAPVRIDGENDAQLTVEATADLGGAAVFARLTFDDGRTYVESAPVILVVDDHGSEVPDTELSIDTSRSPDDYWVGQTATLTATQSVPTGLTVYRWLVKKPGEQDFAPVAGQSGATYSFKPTRALDGVQVKAQLLHGEEVHAESPVVTVSGRQRPVATTLLVAQDKPVYAPGETAHLTSTQQPETGIEHYHWYIKRAGASDYVWVDQSRDKDLDLEVTAEDDGAQLVIRLFDETHATIAESAPVTLRVAVPGPVDEEKPSAAPAARTGSELQGVAEGGLGAVPTTVQAGGTITVQLGAQHAGAWVAAWTFSEPSLIGGDWLQADATGALTLQLPADLPAGQHRLAVFAADGTLIGWTSIMVAAPGDGAGIGDAGSGAGTGAGVDGSLPVTGADASPFVALAGVMLLLGAGVVVLARRSGARQH